MDEVVRQALDDDHRELARLESIARAGLTDMRGGPLRFAECPPVENWNELIVADDHLVLIALLDDVPVGYLVMRYDADAGRGKISHVYVEVEGRELGFGDGMVQRAVDAVRAAGLDGIEAVALPGDRETKNLFERAGLTARKLIVYKSLRTEPA